MSLDNPLADGQADAGARIFTVAVEPLEDLEDPVEILGLHANSFVMVN